MKLNYYDILSSQIIGCLAIIGYSELCDCSKQEHYITDNTYIVLLIGGFILGTLLNSVGKILESHILLKFSKLDPKNYLFDRNNNSGYCLLFQKFHYAPKAVILDKLFNQVGENTKAIPPKEWFDYAKLFSKSGSDKLEVYKSYCSFSRSLLIPLLFILVMAWKCYFELSGWGIFYSVVEIILFVAAVYQYYYRQYYYVREVLITYYRSC